MDEQEWEEQIRQLLRQSRELLHHFRMRYPKLTDDQVMTVALEWYMRAAVNHGLDPRTLEPLVETKGQDEPPHFF